MSPDSEAIRELALAVAALRSEIADVRDAVGRVEALLGGVTSDGGRDRRRHPRSKVATAVSILSDRYPGHSLAGTVVDYSTGGLAVVLDVLIPLGSYVTFLPLGNAAPGNAIEARVTNRAPQGSRWRVGCEFLRTPTAEERAAYQFA